MIGYHPPVGQINVLLKLTGDHLGVDLHHGPLQPVAHSLAVAVVIAEYFDAITNLIGLFLFRNTGEV